MDNRLHETWDQREYRDFDHIQHAWQSFSSPGFIARNVGKLTSEVGKHIPEKVKNKAEELLKSSMEWAMIQKALEVATKGFGFLGKKVLKYTVSKKLVEKHLSDVIGRECRFDEICEQRSYLVQKSVFSREIYKTLQACVEGGATGAFGYWGIPFNIALSMALFFRAAQDIALHYGYDVLDDPIEMDILSDIFINAYSPTADQGAKKGGLMFGNILLKANMSNLATNVNKMTLKELAEKGGAELFYVQIRAIAHKTAQKALENAGQKGIENVYLRKILEKLAKELPKSKIPQIVPVIGSIFGAGFDMYQMEKVLKGVNLQYHMRFLLEKDERVKLLHGLRDKVDFEIIDK